MLDLYRPRWGFRTGVRARLYRRIRRPILLRMGPIVRSDGGRDVRFHLQ